ncbi:MAG: UvrB/UvrC motif-containing protein [Clostridiales bacterium]|nr:UvrB/UvrC motif-containing protein [Clostridiales bacterium]
MKCQRCKEREANVKIMKQTSGKAPQMLMLCDECARELGIALPGNLMGGGLFGSGIGGAGLGGALGAGGNAGVAQSPLGQMANALPNPIEMLAGAFGAPFGLGLEGLLDDSNEEICPTCKMTRSQFTKRGFLGCSDCYNVFAPYIDPMFLRTQMGSKHVGRKPGASGSIEIPSETDELPIIKQVDTPADEVENLSEEEKAKRLLLQEKEKLLKQAIKEENYQEAAKLRDEIRAIKGEEDDT